MPPPVLPSFHTPVNRPLSPFLYRSSLRYSTRLRKRHSANPSIHLNGVTPVL
jgi:hypothetical protein